MSDVAVVKKDKFEVEFQATGGTIKLNPNIVRKYLVHGRAELVTETEIVMFMAMCRYQGLNPFLRECYLIKYSPSDPATMVTGKDTFVKRAAGIPECEGYNAGIIVRKGTEVIKRKGANVMDGEELIGGWAVAYRKGWKEPVEIEVSLKEFVRYSAKGEPTKSWREMPAVMIRKVALVSVLRETFPERYSQLYSPEEMPVDDSKLPTSPVEIPESEEPKKQSPGPDIKDPKLNAAFDKPEGGLPRADDPKAEKELDIF